MSKEAKRQRREYQFQRLAKINSIHVLWEDDFFQKEFVSKYQWDLPRLAYDIFGVDLTYQQLEVWEEYMSVGGFRGGRLAVPSGHGTGKTKFIGVISAMHLLCFSNSITRIQAPKLDQVKKYSFKEIESCIKAIGAVRRTKDGKFVPPRWDFLLKFIKITKEKIYIIGSERSWYIEAVTAPRGDSTNLSGQHQLNFLLILDEASGIEDEHIQTSLGALTEEFNSCIALSQHTQQRGKFNELVSSGVWGTKRLSSRYSPRVGIEQLKIMLSTYTEDEVRVRVDGLPPKKEAGMLIDAQPIHEAYKNTNDIFKGQFKSIAFSYDVGYSGYRDASVIVASEVKAFVSQATGREKQAYKILDIERSAEEGVRPMSFIQSRVYPYILSFLKEQEDKGIFYENIYVIGDANSGGDEAWYKLEELLLEGAEHNFILKGLKWGSEKLFFEDKKRFINARAKGFVKIKEALEDGFVSFETDKEKRQVIKELSQIPYIWTINFLYKILSKEEMRKMTISSPDVGDAIAQLPLLAYIQDQGDYDDNVFANDTSPIDLNQEEIEYIEEEEEEAILGEDKLDASLINTISIDDDF